MENNERKKTNQGKEDPNKPSIFVSRKRKSLDRPTQMNTRKGKVMLKDATRYTVVKQTCTHICKYTNRSSSVKQLKGKSRKCTTDLPYRTI